MVKWSLVGTDEVIALSLESIINAIDGDLL